MQLTERDVSILTQVAFKAAVEQFDGAPLDDAAIYSQFEARIVDLTGTLVSAVEVAVEKHAKSVAAPAAAPRPASGTAAPAADGEFNVTVVETRDGNGQNGPLPAWFVKAAAAAGVTRVYDNRHRLTENPKLPWFKDADGGSDGKPFWPPKGK